MKVLPNHIQNNGANIAAISTITNQGIENINSHKLQQWTTNESTTTV